LYFPCKVGAKWVYQSQTSGQDKDKTEQVVVVTSVEEKAEVTIVRTGFISELEKTKEPVPGPTH
jgi:hypothetical protein